MVFELLLSGRKVRPGFEFWTIERGENWAAGLLSDAFSHEAAILATCYSPTVIRVKKSLVGSFLDCSEEKVKLR